MMMLLVVRWVEIITDLTEPSRPNVPREKSFVYAPQRAINAHKHSSFHPVSVFFRSARVKEWKSKRILNVLCNDTMASSITGLILKCISTIVPC